MSKTRRPAVSRRHFLAAAGAVTLARPAISRADGKKLTIWWAKGFYESENVAIGRIVEAFQKQSGIPTELSLFSIDDANTKAISAVAAGNPPDIGFGASYDFSARGQWAFDGKLDDLSAIIAPISGDLIDVARDSVQLLNGKTGKRSFYAFPIAIADEYIFYWRDMLTEAGFNASDIPASWHDYWNFWGAKVQPALRAKGKRVYGVGSPTSSAAGDTTVQFLDFLSAYGVQCVGTDGNLLLGEPAVKPRVIAAMDDYCNIYRQGWTPTSSLAWTDTDNNNYLYNKTLVMTPNSSLSIPGKFLDEKNEQAYYHDLVTADFPNGVDGKPAPQVSNIKAAVVFADAVNKPAAHDFLKFFAQPANYQPYIEGALGRWVPVTKSALQSPFWSDEKDPHRSVAARMALGPHLPYPTIANYRFTAVNAENVWGKAMARILQDKVATPQAVDEMIARIQVLLTPA